MAVALTVGGWFASAFIEKLADKVFSFIGVQYEYQIGITDRLKNLEGNLRKIQATVYAAEQKQIENPGLKAWLLDLKDASYVAEDVIDMFEYQLLEGKTKVSSNLASTSHRLCKRARTIGKRLLFSDDELNEIVSITERFKKIVTEMGCFLQLISLDRSAGLKESIIDSRLTTSTLIEREVFGRDSEITHVIGLLLGTECNKNSYSTENIVDVLPIVGIGGVGKTTLAQCVYSDQRLKDKFNLRAWVCVSDKFDAKRLMKEISESASIDRPDNFHNLQNVDSIQEILKRGLKGKRFLIVLDDVWSEDTRKWEMLHSTLNYGKEGSMIIVTTRSQKIADMMGTKEAISLKGLSDQDFWTFFVKCAFGDKNPMVHLELESIARKIAKRLGCLPLAAKTLGSALKSNFKEKHWRGILESKLWEKDQGDIMPILRLSYEHLPPHLKQCFVYCSLFPKDYIFSKEKIIRMWIAQGFVDFSRENCRMEDTGRTYLSELQSRSFFMKTPYKDYVIHDLLHDLAQTVAGCECIRFEDQMTNEDLVEIPITVRHLYTHAGNLTMVCDNKHAKKHLRSLVVFGPFDNTVVSLDDLVKLRSLRLLILSYFHVRWFPKNIGKLTHLRYLEIDQNVVGCDTLPESLCKLYHLQVLDIGYKTLHQGIKSLISLRHIHASAKNIAEVGKLTSLQELVFDVKKENSGYEMRQLQSMRHLKHLSINSLSKVRSKEEASDAKLDSKYYLEHLSLAWGKGSHTNPDEILEALQPHENLKHLRIEGYFGFNSPSWLDRKLLSNLVHIYLGHCSKWKVLPPLGQLPFLKRLHLYDMSAVQHVGLEFYGDDNTYGAFPSLESLKFVSMPEWKIWSGVGNGSQLFPRLSHLQIHFCFKLRGPIFLPPLLKTLHISSMPVNKREITPGSLFLSLHEDFSIFTEWIPLQSLSSIETMLICLENEVISFTDELEEWIQHLTSLQSLCFHDCKYLDSLPYILKNLSSLSVLSIKSCSSESLPEDIMPSSLTELYIDCCHSVLMERCRKDGLDWHKISHIPTIKIDGEVVQKL